MGFLDQIKMAKVVVSLRIMPESIDISLSELKRKVEKEIKDFNDNNEIKIEEEAIGFGLSALIFIFVMDEEKGDTEPLENKLKEIDGVRSVEVTDVRRAIG